MSLWKIEEDSEKRKDNHKEEMEGIRRNAAALSCCIFFFVLNTVIVCFQFSTGKVHDDTFFIYFLRSFFFLCVCDIFFFVE